ncbi:MAG: nucleotide exchange factor GrpE [Candidatus Latescibacterota bacterium]
MKKNDKIPHTKEHNGKFSDKAAQKEEKTPPIDIELQAKQAAIQSELEEKLSDLTEKYIRLLAEYDNYRKRTAREFESVITTAAEKLVAEFLPILDNLDRATEHRTNKTTYEDYVKGIALIEDQLRAILARAGLETIEVMGKNFDPAVHSAIMQVESETAEPGTVIAEAEKGYLLNGKIIRHPKVVVSKQKEKDGNKE